MDEQTLQAIAEWGLEEDMRRAEERGVCLALLERDCGGTLSITDEGALCHRLPPIAIHPALTCHPENG